MVKDGRAWLNPGANATAPPPRPLSLTVSLGFTAMGTAFRTQWASGGLATPFITPAFQKEICN